jgi:hypothetical protein
MAAKCKIRQHVFERSPSARERPLGAVMAGAASLEYASVAAGLEIDGSRRTNMPWPSFPPQCNTTIIGTNFIMLATA